ncbi:MAG TPA: hypothetical protein VGZ26_00285 [Pirellulales bacterium]|nr:hypothetical protein [Pirellulales bacterium]
MEKFRYRTWQLMVLLIGFSWLVMMAVHEIGHVLNAKLSGGMIERVVLSPFEISRTDVSPNPHPQFVAWGGAIWGTTIPLVLMALARFTARTYTYLAVFFAGFCCLANGLYLAAGSFAGVGDAGDLLRHGAARWQLWLFGVPVSILGLWLWNGLGPSFGFGPAPGKVDSRVVVGLGVALLIIVVLELLFSPS